MWSTHNSLWCSGSSILTFPRIRLYSALWSHNLNTLNEILSRPGFVFWKNYSLFQLSSTLGKSDEPGGLCCLQPLLKYQSSGQTRCWGRELFTYEGLGRGDATTSKSLCRSNKLVVLLHCLNHFFQWRRAWVF